MAGVLLTPVVVRDIAQIVADHHAALAAVLLGKDAVAPHDWALAVQLGIVDPAAAAPGVVAALHAYGAAVAHLGQAAAQKRYGTTVANLLEAVRRDPVPMTEQEHRSAEWASAHAASLLVGLGNKAGATLGSDLIEADAELDARLRGTVRDVIAARFGDEDAAARMRARGIERGLDDDFFDGAFRETTKQIASDIGHATGDWARDLGRIAHTEGHTAAERGMAGRWQAQTDEDALRLAREAEAAGRVPPPPRGVLVFKLPRPGACSHCIDLHLDGGVPRIYRLADAEGNGTNAGRKAADWRFVVGSVHPWCGCSLSRVPSVIAADMPRGWAPGHAAPSVIGAGGRVGGSAEVAS